MPVIRINGRYHSKLDKLRGIMKASKKRAWDHYSWSDFFRDVFDNGGNLGLPGQCNGGHEDPVVTAAAVTPGSVRVTGVHGNSSSQCNTDINVTRRPDVTPGRLSSEKKLRGSPTPNMTQEKFILDVCCGGRCGWFNKEHPHTTYMDLYPRPKGTIPNRPNFHVTPDLIADFRDIPEPDESKRLVYFDPPHLVNPELLEGRYGKLNPDTWRDDLRKGFKECWRVLAVWGTLIFKWSEAEIPLKEVLTCFDEIPLFGHTTSKHGRTKFMVYLKFPKDCPGSVTPARAVTHCGSVTPAGEQGEGG